MLSGPRTHGHRVLKSADTSNKEAITVLRQTVEENGGFDKDYIKKSMMAEIKLEHPLVPAKPAPAVRETGVSHKPSQANKSK